MTEKIREYFEIKNSPIGSIWEEIGKNVRLMQLMGDLPEHKRTNITRFILDKGDVKQCVFEAENCDDNEKAFILRELKEKYKCRVFAVNEVIFEVCDGENGRYSTDNTNNS